MSTPPEQPGDVPGPGTVGGHAAPSGGPSSGYGGLGRSPTTGAILPLPGNAELLVYLGATVFLIIIWAASDVLDAHGFATLFTWLTIGYILSRGIAKASRVLEQ